MISSVEELLESVGQSPLRDTEEKLVPVSMDKNVPILSLSNVTGKGLDPLKKFFHLLSLPTAGSSPAVEENSSGEKKK